MTSRTVSAASPWEAESVRVPVVGFGHAWGHEGCRNPSPSSVVADVPFAVTKSMHVCKAYRGPSRWCRSRHRGRFLGLSTRRRAAWTSEPWTMPPHGAQRACDPGEARSRWRLDHDRQVGHDVDVPTAHGGAVAYVARARPRSHRPARAGGGVRSRARDGFGERTSGAGLTLQGSRRVGPPGAQGTGPATVDGLTGRATGRRRRPHREGCASSVSEPVGSPAIGPAPKRRLRPAGPAVALRGVACDAHTTTAGGLA